MFCLGLEKREGRTGSEKLYLRLNPFLKHQGHQPAGALTDADCLHLCLSGLSHGNPGEKTMLRMDGGCHIQANTAEVFINHLEIVPRFQEIKDSDFCCDGFQDQRLFRLNMYVRRGSKYQSVLVATSVPIRIVCNWMKLIKYHEVSLGWELVWSGMKAGWMLLEPLVVPNRTNATSLASYFEMSHLSKKKGINLDNNIETSKLDLQSPGSKCSEVPLPPCASARAWTTSR